MTENTAREVLVGIGELSRRTGVPVRTIRFYCDEGILESRRSTGGHRLFDPVTAVDRVGTVRRLRALGLGLPVITGVLAGTVAVTDAVAAERAALDEELDALTWRRAVLRAVEDAPPASRAARLARVAAVGDRRRAHDDLVRFWRGLLGPVPAPLVDGFVAMNVPDPPRDPTVRHLVAYAELAAVVTDRSSAAVLSRQIWRTDPADIRHGRELATGVAEACESVGPLVLARTAPRPGAELDRFVAAHAAARGERDTARLRRRLLAGAADTDPRTLRYWALTSELVEDVTVGATHHWLYRALRRSVDPAR